MPLPCTYRRSTRPPTENSAASVRLRFFAVICTILVSGGQFADASIGQDNVGQENVGQVQESQTHSPQQQNDPRPPRCTVLPGANQDFSILIDGQLRAAWNFTKSAPRPFLYPLIGPSGQSVTRMGHPGAPDHDHHRSVRFAHHKLEGQDFWSEPDFRSKERETTARKGLVRQVQWYALEDGDDAARFAVQLEWIGQGQDALMQQDVVLEFRPIEREGESSEWTVEVQSVCKPAAERTSVTLEKTNFGLLAVRVSKSISQAFGLGTLTSDDGQTGEPQIFGKPHRWVDYSGSSPRAGKWSDEGITYFDHPSNPGFPNAWHVRADGWMCSSPCFSGDLTCTEDKPLTLRYLLHIHAGRYDPQLAASQFDAFADSPPFLIRKSQRPHTRYEIVRKEVRRAD